MSAHLDRASLITMGVGLLLVGQPWVHALFVLGFPLLLIGITAQGAAAVLRACVLRGSVLRACVPRARFPRARFPRARFPRARSREGRE